MTDDGKSVYRIFKPRYNEAWLEGLWFKPLAWKCFCQHLATPPCHFFMSRVAQWWRRNMVAVFSGLFDPYKDFISYGAGDCPLARSFYRATKWQKSSLGIFNEDRGSWYFAQRLQGVLRISSDGGDRMGGSVRLPTKPKNSLGQKLTPKKSHAEFPNLKIFQKALNDITCVRANISV